MKFEAEIWVNASPAKVFEVISDVERMHVFDPDVKSVTITSKKKRGLGVTSHWVSEVVGKKKEWNEEVIEYDPPRVFGFRIKADYRETLGRHVLTPERNGTRIHSTENHIRGGYDPKTSAQRMQTALEKIKNWAEKE